MNIRVAVADDQPLVRAGISMLLSAQDDIDVVVEAGDGKEVLDLVRVNRVDVVVMDVRMPVLDGVEATRQLAADSADPDHPVRVLILTTFDDDDAVYNALRSGASGMMLKHAAPKELVTAVRAIAEGNSWIDPRVAGRVIDALGRAPGSSGTASRELIERLTSREIEILQLMALGLSNADIRARLVVSDATVRTHVSRILMKTGSHDRSQAVVLAYQTGLVTPTAGPS